MARPEKPIAPDAPYGAFARRLRALRRDSGNPTYRAMAVRLGHRCSVTTLAAAASGDALPSLDVTLAYAEACEGDPQYWTEQWYLAGRQDTLWDAELWAVTPPRPELAADPAEYVARLRELRLWAGSPSLTLLARLTGVSRSCLADAHSPRRTTLPTRTAVSALVLGCLKYAQASRSWLKQRGIAAADPDLAELAWLRVWQRLRAREGARIPLAPPPPQPAPAAWQAPAAPQAPEPPEPVRPSWTPLAANLREERRDLALALRELFDVLGISLRRYGARVHYAPSAVSRYFNGDRLPPREFILELFDELERAHHVVSPRHVDEVLALHTAARRSSDSPYHRIAHLEEELREAQAQLAALRR
ncbi:helix-turn-helix domain-containing protein [Streptomyces sp. NPDC059989]|uniref:helix-turn-helix domain-containing protein n=1 Tax=Streptomyces sp. NPDC059989 TaxID=3347026 RepID=UPI0036A04A90